MTVALDNSAWAHRQAVPGPGHLSAALPWCWGERTHSQEASEVGTLRVVRISSMARHYVTVSVSALSQGQVVADSSQ